MGRDAEPFDSFDFDAFGADDDGADVDETRDPDHALLFLPDEREPISIGKAVFFGHLLVSGGVIAIVIATMLVGLTTTSISPFLLALLGAVVAWPWWSATVPVWWRWALARGADPYDLQRLAEATQLVWPRDSLLAKTEFGDRWAGIDTPVLEGGRGLRDQVLLGPEVDPEDDPSRDGPLWAVVVEFGFPDGAWSLLAFDDGTCVLEDAKGGAATVQAGDDPRVVSAVRVLHAAAREVAATLGRVRLLDRPTPGEVTAFLVYADGVLGARASRKEVQPDGALGVVLAAAQKVVATVRGEA